MGLAANIRRDLKFAAGLRRLLKRIKPIELDSDVLICDDFEEAVDKFRDNVAIEDEHRVADLSRARRHGQPLSPTGPGAGNLRRADVIALVMTNRAEYLAAWMGFSKVGIATALINTNLTGQALAHCLNIANVAAGGGRRGDLAQGRGGSPLRRPHHDAVGARPEGQRRGGRATRPGQRRAQRLVRAPGRSGPRRPDQPRHGAVHLHLGHDRHAQGGAHPPMPARRTYMRAFAGLHPIDAGGPASSTSCRSITRPAAWSASARPC